MSNVKNSEGGLEVARRGGGEKMKDQEKPAVVARCSGIWTQKGCDRGGTQPSQGHFAGANSGAT